jgi:hypothetical protein
MLKRIKIHCSDFVIDADKELIEDILVDALLKMDIVPNGEFGWEIELLVSTDSCIV